MSLLRLTIALLLTTVVPLVAQTLSVVHVDTSAYPWITASVIATGADGGIVDPGPLVVRDGDSSVTVTPDCPGGSGDEASIAIVVDRSASMTTTVGSGGARLDLVRSAITDLLRAARPSSTRIALVAFDDLPTLLSPFTTDRSRLLEAVARLSPGGSTDFNPPLLDPLIGATALLAEEPSTPSRRILFITDGEPVEPLALDSIVAAAAKVGASVHVLTIGTSLESGLTRLALLTGGSAIGDIDDAARLKGLLLDHLLRAEGRESCRIGWEAPAICTEGERRRSVRITSTFSGSEALVHYMLPEVAVRLPLVEPGLLLLDSSGTGTITLTARGSIVINGVTLDVGDVVDWGGTPPPMMLGAGETRRIRLRQQHGEASDGEARVDLAACGPIVLPIVRASRGIGERLRLLEPVGGEILDGCDSLRVRWTGVDRLTPVAVEIETAPGRWRRLADSARGGLFAWLPDTALSSTRVRIIVEGGRDSISTVAGGGSGGDGVALAAELLSPAGVTIEGEVAWIAESAGHRVRRVDLATGMISTSAGTGATGASGDGGQATTARLANPADVVVGGERLLIADYTNDRIRRVDLTTGTISTLATNRPIGTPTSLALASQYILVASDRDSAILAVETAGGMVTPVAGGGMNPEGDGDNALTVRLAPPLSITVAGDTLFVSEGGANRVRAVDLRTRIISTVVGPGAGLRTPSGLAASGDWLFIADKGSHRIVGLDRRRRALVTLAGRGGAGSDGDGGEPLAARLNAPHDVAAEGTTIVVTEIASGRVRRIDLRSLGSADSSGAIVLRRPELAVGASAITFAPLSVGASRDTLLSALLCNRGTAAAELSLSFTGVDAAAFQIVALPSLVPAGGCVPIELRFKPRRVGPHAARLEVVAGCAAPMSIDLTGAGTEACGVSSVRRIDIGAMPIGRITQVTIDSLLCNGSDRSIAGVVSVPSDEGVVRLLSDSTITLASGSCAPLVVSVLPVTAAPFSAEVRFAAASGCTTRTLLVGRGVDERSLRLPDTVRFDTTFCEPHERTIPLRLASSDSVTLVRVELLDTTGAFSAGSLPLPLLITPFDSTTLTIGFRPGATGGFAGRLRIVTAGRDTLTSTLIGFRGEIALAADPQILSFDAGASLPVSSRMLLRNDGTESVRVDRLQIVANEAAKFDLDTTGLLPRILAPGDSLEVVTLLVSLPDSLLAEGRLEVFGEPTCDSLLARPLLVATRGLAHLTAMEPEFLLLRCDSDSSAGFRVDLRNVGTATATITSMTLRIGSPFSIESGTPTDVARDSVAAVLLRFAPSERGRFDDTLIITTAAGQVVQVPIAAERRRIAIRHDRIAATGDVRRLRLTNEGTRSSLSLRSSGGGFEVAPPRLLLEADEVFDIEVARTHGGALNDSLVIFDDECGAVAIIPISWREEIGRLVLPIDSGAGGSIVRLPIRVDPLTPIPEGELWSIELEYRGTILRGIGAVDATLDSITYDRATGRERVWLSGVVAGASLGSLECEVMGGERSTTLVKLRSGSTSARLLIAEDGSFTRTDDCSAPTLASRPTIVSIAPNPAGDHVALRLASSVEQEIAIVVTNVAGEVVAHLDHLRLGEGSTTLQLDLGRLPSGTYILTTSGPFGSDQRRVVILR